MSYNLPINEKDFLVTLSAAINSTEDKKQELYKELEKIKISSDSLFEKLDYTAKSDSEIENNASNANESEYIKKLQNLLSDYAIKAENTENLKGGLKSKVESEKQSVKEYYENSKKQSENQALKRGLGRSSVIMNIIEKYDSNKNEKLSSIEKSLTESLMAIDNQLSTLEAEKQQTVSNLEMDKSIALAEKIQTLKNERDKKVAEVAKFNNDVVEKDLKYQNSKKSITAEEQRDINHKKVKLILDYYAGKSPTEVYENFSKDNKFRVYLGDYYSELSQILRSRAENSNK